jgi:hypothetical protein
MIQNETHIPYIGHGFAMGIKEEYIRYGTKQGEGIGYFPGMNRTATLLS